MLLRAVDRDGWILCFESTLDAEGRLEWLGVSEGEYIIIDDDAFLYAWLTSDDSDEPTWERFGGPGAKGWIVPAEER